MASRSTNRPLSPHLQIWKWGPHMLVSILHRATGTAMATAGTAALVWWLAATAAGEQSYAGFHHFFFEIWGGTIGYLLAVGLSWSFFQHMLSGVRHFFLDAGAGFELKTNKMFSVLTVVGSITLTALFWFYLLKVKA